MFYCKDVKYDMCELKKNHDKKNKICKTIWLDFFIIRIYTLSKGYIKVKYMLAFGKPCRLRGSGFILVLNVG